MSVKSLQLMFSAAQQVEEQSKGAAGLVRSAVFAIHVIREEQRFYCFRLIVAIEELAEAAGKKRN